MLGLYAGDTATTALLRPVIAALRRQQGPALGGMANLVGVGIGLTPSGDDFLAGMLLAEQMVTLAGLAPDVQMARHDIARALPRTTAAGRTLLWQALQGVFPAYLLDLVRSFCRRPAATTVHRSSTDEDFVPCLRRVLAHGHTSGTDAVVGFLWYLDCVKGACRTRGSEG
jgi:hypothetical protein